MNAGTRRRLDAIEEHITARVLAKRERIIQTWICGMDDEDLDLMGEIARRSEAGEPETAVLDSLTPVERDRVVALTAEYYRLEAEHDDRS